MGQGLGFFFFILSCVCLGGPCFCSAHTDSIKPGEGLQFSKLLVSAQGTFTLGFFILDTRSYLGIWYTSDVNNKKVWVANRDNPISGTNANLMLDGNGTLMIIHSGGDPIVLNSNQASRNSIATLFDSGNFVVSALNSDGSVKQTLWESFDDPTDTLLPGMKLGINLKTGQNWSLASWINEQVPDPGTFTLEWNGTQLVIKRRGDIYWSSGILKDRSFEFIQTHHNIYYFISVCNDNEIYFSYSVQDGAISKWVLNWRGGFFDTYGTLFVKEDMCDPYDKYPGCAVQEPPTCRTTDFQFMKQSVLNSGYPSLMNIDTSLGLSDCQAICRNNCSCTACNTVFTNETGCQFWRDKLPRARVGDANQEELYVLSSSKDIDENKIGKGGFGSVYKGILPGGQEIAVKRLSGVSTWGLDQFVNERLIVNQQHRNLIRLLGYCSEGEERMLIYELLPNGNLEDLIFDPDRRKGLDWNTWCNIIKGIAQGLDYLHNHSRLNMVHGDLKASNILLDDDMNPKISDFGTARIFERNESEPQTSKLVGTFGYMPPEYFSEGWCSPKTDVYSFGVLMLEIVSGQRIIPPDCKDDNLSLIRNAWKLWGEGNSLKLVDPAMVGPHSTTQIVRWIRVALLCIQKHEERPTMSDVCSMLNRRDPPEPNPPAIFALR
uniref:non-specific serine/threonine protein kinase n=1 Tax=Vitis vinifera TaxID=29760 RepID=A5AST3_VITVI|nr:hypothetical protein VITISV_031091 [Vitis vinifera]